MDLIKTKIENLLYKKFYNQETRQLEIRHDGLTYKGKDPKVFRFRHHGTHYIFDVVLYTSLSHVTINNMRVENSKNKNSLIL